MFVYKFNTWQDVVYFVTLLRDSYSGSMSVTVGDKFEI